MTHDTARGADAVASSVGELEALVRERARAVRALTHPVPPAPSRWPVVLLASQVAVIGLGLGAVAIVVADGATLGPESSPPPRLAVADVEEPAPPPAPAPPPEPAPPPPTQTAAVVTPPAPPSTPRITAFPHTSRGDTSTSSTRRIDRYPCAPGTPEAGAEVWYEVDVPGRGFLTAWIAEEPRKGVDVDLHLLKGTDGERCLRRGHYGIAGNVSRGTHWLVVDTFGNAGATQPGPFTLHVTFAPAR